MQSFLNYKLENVSIKGSEWKTGIFVDVVSEISKNSTREKSLIIQKHQYIERTE
jgi:hypothetical protein